MLVMIVFALFFVFIGFIGGLFVACDCTLGMLRDSVNSKKPFIGKYNITVASDFKQE